MLVAPAVVVLVIEAAAGLKVKLAHVESPDFTLSRALLGGHLVAKGAAFVGAHLPAAFAMAASAAFRSDAGTCDDSP